MLVIDASVIVADLRPSEPHHSAAAALLAYLREHNLPAALPVIAVAEIAGAVARGTRRAALAQRAVRLVQSTPHYQWSPIDWSLALRAAAVAADYRLRGYDAVYLALAQQLGAPLVTLDAELTRRRPPDVEVRGPEEQLARLLAE